MGHRLNQFIRLNRYLVQHFARRKKQTFLKSPTTYYVLLTTFLLVLIYIVVTYSHTPDPALPTSFQKASLFSGWDYQTNNSNPLQVSAKSAKSGNAVNISYQNADVSFGLPMANAKVTQTNLNELSYTSNSKQMTVKYHIEPNRLKEDIILADVPQDSQFSIPLSLNHAEVQLTTDNIPVIIDSKTKQYLFHVERPYATDANGITTYAAKYRLETDDKKPQTITYPHEKGKLNLLGAPKSIDLTNKKYRLILEVDSTWLNDPARAYPVTIDPTVVHDTGTEFSGGQLNRVTNTGTTDNSPILETYYQEQTADVNTVGLWHLNEASGNALDASGNSNTGTPTGTTVVAGLLNNARSFNGTSGDFIDIPSSTSLQVSSAFTIETWVKRNTSSGAFERLISKSDTTGYDYYIQIYPDNTFSCGVITSTDVYRVSSSTVPVGNWVHLACTYNSTTGFNLYMNGVLSNGAASGTPAAVRVTTRNLNFGRLGASGFYYSFNGYLDEVRISNIARSPEEIKAAASRRPSSTYTSGVIDFTNPISSWNPLSWTEAGASTGDSETPYSSTGLVAQWNFNETSGTTADNAQGTAALDGTLTNFASTASQDQAARTGWTTANRRWGTGALMFDGSNDYVNVSDNDSLDLTSALTIEAWVNHSATGVFDGILQKGSFTNSLGNYEIHITDANKIRFVLNNDSTNASITGNINIDPGTWYHIVATYDQTTMKIYINGVLDGSKSYSTVISTDSNPLRIGSYYDASSYIFGGTIDSVRLYSRALTASEIISNYNAGAVELQTRVGATADPNDGSWEAWSPSTGETQLLSLDSDSANWAWDSTATYMPKSSGSDTTLKQEGASSLKLTNQTQVDANTVGLWHLDETGGTGAYIKDATANANNGTPTGTTLINGISSKGRSFNGSSDYINVGTGASLNLTSAVTIEAWIKLNSYGGAWAGIYDKRPAANNAGYYLTLYNNTGGLSGGNATGTCLANVTSAILPLNQWVYVATTMSVAGNSVVIYVNGVSQGSSTCSSLPGTSDAAYIGKNAVSSAVVDGSIDEVRISNTARSAEEIAEAYRLGRDHYLNRTISSTDLSGSNLASIKVAADRPGNYLAMTYGESAFANYQSDANTSALWHMDEQSGSGAYIKDAGPNGYHITPTGTTSVMGKIGQGRYFNGSSYYLPLSSSLNAPIQTGSFTISGWMNAASTTNPFPLLHRGFVLTSSTYYGISFHLDSAGVYIYRNVGSASQNVVSYAFTPTTNTWYYLTTTYDKSTGATNLYLNGQLISSGTLSTSNVAYYATYDVGYMAGATLRNVTNSYGNGIIDELRIDSAVRSATDIRQAYESGLRTHPLTIDFGAKLDSGNLITSTSDTSFTIDATALGLNQKGSSLFLGDKIIVKENVDGTEYIAQGTVNAITASTGVTTVAAWDSGSTVPSGGFTVNATVFKWQTEYLNLNKSMSDQRNAITNLTLRLTDGNEGRTVYLDDFRSITNYLTANTSSTITSSADNRYLQYRAVLASADEYVTPALTSVTLDYNSNLTSSVPTLNTSYQADKVKTPDQTPEFRFSSTDTENDDLVYEIQWDTNTTFSSATSKVSDVDTGFTNLTTPADISPFTQGNSIAFTVQSNLTNATTYFYRVRAKDPSGTDAWTDWSSVKSFTIDTSLLHNQWHETHASQFATDTITGDTTISATNHNVTVPEAVVVSSTVDAMEYATDATAQAAYVTNGSAIESGGTITYTDSSGANPRSSPRYSGGYAVHTFTGSGTFTSSYSKSISSLIVAGGGGGGTVTNTTQNPTGGGGAGGVIVQTPQTVAAGSHTVTVGNGGAHSSAGSNSVFNSLTAIGGGRGGGSYAGYTGGNGGSGGGGATTPYVGGSGTSGQGYAGAAGTTYYGGGGGGAGAAATSTSGANGIASSISGVSTYYGGGGGQGSGYSGSAGGLGGGGTGGQGDYSGSAGTANTGGGGGGSGGNYWTYGGAGGSGIVILRYPSDPYLESYSESTIKTTGSYALKGVAAITNSLNKTLTRTISSPLDLSNMSNFTFDIRSTRTGSNIKIGLHDSGGTTTEVTPNITSANAFQSISLDISGVANTNKDAIDQIIITIVNSDAANTFYLDNLQSSYSIDGIGTIISTSITASTIRTASRWKALNVNQSNIDNNLTYQIYYDVSGTPTIVPDSALPGNSSGFSTLPVNLASLTTASYPILYIKANLAYTTASPIIDDWTVSLNEVPQTPTLNSPTDTAIDQPPLTVFSTTGTDIDLDNLQYKILLCTDTAMTQNCQTVDQTASQTGWSATSYASGTPATHTLQAPLLPDTTYYWKTNSIDPDGTNIWSATQTTPYSFTTKPAPTAAAACRIHESGTDTTLSVIWTDVATNEYSYEIRRSVDGGAFTILTTMAANSLTFTDTTVTGGHTYAYGIAPYLLGPVYGTWCVTPTLSLQSGTTSVSGLKMQGIQIK